MITVFCSGCCGCCGGSSSSSSSGGSSSSSSGMLCGNNLLVWSTKSTYIILFDMPFCNIFIILDL